MRAWMQADNKKWPHRQIQELSYTVRFLCYGLVRILFN